MRAQQISRSTSSTAMAPSLVVNASSAPAKLPRQRRDHLKEFGGFTAMIVKGSAVGVAVVALMKLIGLSTGVLG